MELGTLTSSSCRDTSVLNPQTPEPGAAWIAGRHWASRPQKPELPESLPSSLAATRQRARASVQASRNLLSALASTSHSSPKDNPYVPSMKLHVWPLRWSHTPLPSSPWSWVHRELPRCDPSAGSTPPSVIVRVDIHLPSSSKARLNRDRSNGNPFLLPYTLCLGLLCLHP